MTVLWISSPRFHPSSRYVGPPQKKVSEFDTLLFIGVAVSTQETTDIFDRGIERIANPHFCFNLGTVILGAIPGPIPEMRYLVVGKENLPVIGYTIDDRVTDPF